MIIDGHSRFMMIGGNDMINIGDTVTVSGTVTNKSKLYTQIETSTGFSFIVSNDEVIAEASAEIKLQEVIFLVRNSDYSMSRDELLRRCEEVVNSDQVKLALIKEE